VFGYFLHHFPYFGMRGQDDAAALAAAADTMQELATREFGDAASASAAFCYAAKPVGNDAAFCYAAKPVSTAAFCYAAKPVSAAFCYAAKPAGGTPATFDFSRPGLALAA
jgi:hypothetical protein